MRDLLAQFDVWCCLRRLGFRRSRAWNGEKLSNYVLHLDGRTVYVSSPDGATYRHVFYHAVSMHKFSDSASFANAEELEIAVIYQSLRPIEVGRRIGI